MSLMGDVEERLTNVLHELEIEPVQEPMGGVSCISFIMNHPFL